MSTQESTRADCPALTSNNPDPIKKRPKSTRIFYRDNKCFLRNKCMQRMPLYERFAYFVLHSIASAHVVKKPTGASDQCKRPRVDDHNCRSTRSRRRGPLITSTDFEWSGTLDGDMVVERELSWQCLELMSARRQAGWKNRTISEDFREFALSISSRGSSHRLLAKRLFSAAYCYGPTVRIHVCLQS